MNRKKAFSGTGLIVKHQIESKLVMHVFIYVFFKNNSDISTQCQLLYDTFITTTVEPLIIDHTLWDG